MATVTKDFKVKNGLIVEGTTGTINNYDILTKKADDNTYIVNLIGGTATSANEANKVVKRDANGNFAAGTITANLTGAVTGNASTATTLETSRTIELTGDVTGQVNFNGSANVQISTTLNGSFATDAEVATAKGEAIADAAADATSKANTALEDANDYTDGEISSLDASLKSYADTAEADAKAYTDTRETAITTAYQSYADTAEADAKAYADQKVADLVDSAPALLDTLNELAAAIGDDANFAANLATSVGEKVSKAGDTMTGLLVLSADPSANLGAATKQYVDAAEANANSYTTSHVTDTLYPAGIAIFDPAGSASTAQSNAQTFTTNAINDLDTDDIEEGTTNLYYTDARAKAEAATLLANATKTNIVITKDGSNNLTITAENGVADSNTDQLAEGITMPSLENTADARVSGTLLIYTSK